MDRTTTLSKELTIHRIAEVCKELKEALTEGQELVVDATGTERIDVAGVQVLIAMQR